MWGLGGGNRCTCTLRLAECHMAPREIYILAVCHTERMTDSWHRQGEHVTQHGQEEDGGGLHRREVAWRAGLFN